MLRHAAYILLVALVAFATPLTVSAQKGAYDTIRLGSYEENGIVYPYVFLPEFSCNAKILNAEERKKQNLLRSHVYAAYPYAIAAATIFNKINSDLAKLPDHHARKKYLKSVDKELDIAFKKPLKNMSIEEGHVLIRLIQRQTGENCYDLIKELKGGFAAVFWQSAGVFFNNNLNRSYDPTGQDKDIEAMAQELESSAAYRYQLYLQDELMKKVSKK